MTDWLQSAKILIDGHYDEPETVALAARALIAIAESLALPDDDDQGRDQQEPNVLGYAILEPSPGSPMVYGLFTEVEARRLILSTYPMGRVAEVRELPEVGR